MRKGEQLTAAQTMWCNSLMHSRFRCIQQRYKAPYPVSDYVKYQRAMRWARKLSPEAIAEIPCVGKKGAAWIAQELGRV